MSAADGHRPLWRTMTARSRGHPDRSVHAFRRQPRVETSRGSAQRLVKEAAGPSLASPDQRALANPALDDLHEAAQARKAEPFSDRELTRSMMRSMTRCGSFHFMARRSLSMPCSATMSRN